MSKREAFMPLRYIEVYKSKDGGFRWRRKTRGDTLETGTTSYSRRWNCHRALRETIKTDLPIIDLYDEDL